MIKFKLFLKTISAFILISCTVFLNQSHPPAHAGYFNDVYNNIKEFSELPSEINELKEGYQRALQDLDRARMDIETFQKQNSELAEQNKQLTKMVEQMQQAENAKAQRSERIKTIAFTAIALLAGYFLLTRFLRFGMRRRTNRF